MSQSKVELAKNLILCSNKFRIASTKIQLRIKHLKVGIVDCSLRAVLAKSNLTYI